MQDNVYVLNAFNNKFLEVGYFEKHTHLYEEKCYQVRDENYYRIAGDFLQSDTISGYNVYYRIININYMYKISEQTSVPIELDEENHYIKKIRNLQIVNGGQTTASIYNTQKKDKTTFQIYLYRSQQKK